MILYTISKTNIASENRPGLDPGLFPSSILIGIFRGYVAGMVIFSHGNGKKAVY